MVFRYSTNGLTLTPSRSGVSVGDNRVLTAWGSTSRSDLLTVVHLTASRKQGQEGQRQNREEKNQRKAHSLLHY